ncbi:sigma factor [Rothia nasimurium]|uniref:sigma factor n=1 Tax=Rothia nasimurium TaxID=85336 RepID=UPI0036186F67
MEPRNLSWGEENLTAWQKTRPVIARILGPSHQGAVDDVHQNIYLAAKDGYDRFDPTLGSFSQWITGIAQRQAQAYLRQKNRQTLLEYKAYGDSQVVSSYMHTVADDIADGVIARLDTAVNISHVLKVVKLAVEPQLYARSLSLIRDYEGQASVAASRMGLEVAALRESHRNVQEIARVADRALKGHYERVDKDAPVTVREVLACFPQDGENDMERTWLRIIPLAVMGVGAFALERDALVTKVAQVTGYAPVTVRHAVARFERLCAVAKTVLESGSDIIQ